MLQFGLGADEDDNFVAVSLEGREQAGAEIAGCPKEEDFHGNGAIESTLML